ncbi:hypothetical protein PRIPAC_71692, partial [Pristionchus pacificus]|uniref:G protein-coupled receptor n=1 Tax=Pristionchus pacificus TaxID=54126 RepID=A0A2A6B5D5_PRIPA
KSSHDWEIPRFSKHLIVCAYERGPPNPPVEETNLLSVPLPLLPMIVNSFIDLFNAPTPWNQTLWIPLIVKIEFLGDSMTIYHVILGFEVFFSTSSFSSITTSLGLGWKNKLLHPNLMVIVSTVNGFYLISLLARFLQMFYEIQFIEFQGFHTFPIPWLTLIRSTAYFYLLLFFTAVLVERIFATVLIIDYEKKHRIPISISISSIFFIISFAAAYFLIFELLNPILLAALLLFVNVISAVLFFLLLRYNKRLKTTKCISSSTVTYCLSIRAQVKENIRTMNLLRIGGIVLVSSMSLFIPALVFIPYLMEYDMAMIQISTAAFNALAAFVALIASLTFSLSIEQYRRKIIPRCFANKIDPTEWTLTWNTDRAERETRRHFDEIYKIWNVELPEAKNS